MSRSPFPEILKQLLDDFTRSGIRELHIRKADFELYLSTEPRPGPTQAPVRVSPVAPVPTQASAPAPASDIASPAPSVEKQGLPADAIIVTAPNLGTFYRAPKPGAANYVEVGSRVEAGDELCLIEVMKLFTSLCAGEAGTVHAVLVDDGAMVEAGQPLFALVRN